MILAIDLSLMPTTYNGIGTHYYGNRRRRTRKAVCQICGRPAQLSTYDTRLWFVVLLVPVIPLSRRKIVDQCGVCQQHYSFPLRAWETGRLADLSAAVERYRREPAEDTAAEVHAQLMTYQEFETADSFRKKALDQFVDRPRIRAELASQLELKGLPEPAKALWDEAVDLDSELPEVRLGLGRRALLDEKLEEAREHLRFLEEPGAEQQYSLDPLFDLAAACQRHGQHEQALEIMENLLRAFPQAARDHQIRAFVLQSEKALRRDTTILPKVDHSVDRLFSSQYSSAQRWGLGILLALLLAGVGLLINNEYIRRHRFLTVANDTGEPAVVQIDDQPPVTVDGLQQLPVSEGNHTIRISGAVNAEHRLLMQTSFWRRWSDQPVWIVNVGSEALIANLRVHYAAVPQPPSYHFLMSPTVYLKHIDYPFTEPPDQLPLESSTGQKTVSVVSWLTSGGDSSAVSGNYFALKARNSQAAYDYLLRKVRRRPYDDQLIALLDYETTEDQQPQLRQLLESQIERRPVSVEWHRVYQDLPSVSQDYQTTHSQYAKWLQQDPDNPALLYLAARFEADPERRDQLLDRAAEQPKTVPRVLQLQARIAASAGHWLRARELCDLAVEHGLAPREVLSLQHTASLALGDHAFAEEQLQNILRTSPASLQAAVQLAELKILQDEAEQASQVFQRTAAAFKTEMQGSFEDSLRASEATLSYLQQDLDGFLSKSAGVNHFHYVRALVLLESGDVKSVADGYQPTDDPNSRWLPLHISLAYYRQGDLPGRQKWVARQIAELERLGPRFDDRRPLLTTQRPPRVLIEHIDRLIELPAMQALLLTHAAIDAADRSARTELLEAARRKMIRRLPPYGLLTQVHQKLESEP